MSVNSTNPGTLFGGSWTQITGRFLYCTNTSKTTGGSTTTGSTTLTAAQSGLPSHAHAKNSLGWANNGIWIGSGSYTTIDFDADTNNTGSTGGTSASQGHTHSQNLPPYFTVYCWYRTA